MSSNAASVNIKTAAPMIPIRKNERTPFSTVEFQSAKFTNILDQLVTLFVKLPERFCVTFEEFFRANILYISPGIFTKINAVAVYIIWRFWELIIFSSPIAITRSAHEYTMYTTARKLISTLIAWSTLREPSWSFSRLSPPLEIGHVATDFNSSAQGISPTPANENGVIFHNMPHERRMYAIKNWTFFIEK